MTLKDRLDEDQKAALRGGEQLRLSVLRLLRSAIHYAEGGGPLDDDGVIAVLSKQAKQRRESIEEFRKGNRPDLADKE
ncbi:MAG: GatB/YqeY domain-containing protein, partial [Dehalococcoidia bacterium]|nr:GatB/YqeY domain-containing protein [Dehalococcoidia bacterium]